MIPAGEFVETRDKTNLAVRNSFFGAFRTLSLASYSVVLLIPAAEPVETREKIQHHEFCGAKFVVSRVSDLEKHFGIMLSRCAYDRCLRYV